MAVHTSDEILESTPAILTDDGYGLRYRIWSTQATVRATMVFVAGLMSHSGWFTHVGVELARRGLKVVGADRRGSGPNWRGGGDAPSRDVILADFRHIIDREDCGAPLYIAGWCWGAVLAVNAALSFDMPVSGVALLAPGLFPSKRLKQAVYAAEASYANSRSPELKLLTNVPSPMTDDMFSESATVLRWIANDTLVQRTFTRRFFAISREMSFIAAARVRQLTCPVLLVLAEHDLAVDNTRTRSALARVKGRLTTVQIACGHAVQFEKPAVLVGDICSWLEDQGLQLYRTYSTPSL